MIKRISRQSVGQLVLFLLTMGVFYYYATYFALGGFNIGYQYMGCIFIIILGGSVFLMYPDVPEFLGTMRVCLLLMSPFLVSMLVSLWIWVFSFTGVRQMISGFFEPVYILICLGAVAVLSYFLKQKLVVALFWAVNIAFAIMIVQAMIVSGPGQFFYEMYVLVSSNANETLPIMKQMELPRFSYGYVYFFLYFVCKWKEVGPLRSMLRMVPCVFFFLVGYKRSCMVAVLLGLAMIFLYFKLGSFRPAYLNSVMIGACVIMVVTVPFIRNGMFDELVNKYQIETNSRQSIYDSYSAYYEYSPMYMGRGLGWVADYQRNTEGTTGIHNEYIRAYVELGFWGFLIWIGAAFPVQMKKLIRCSNEWHNAGILAVFVAQAILYFTENIWALYSAVMVIGAIIMEFWQAERGEQDEI